MSKLLQIEPFEVAPESHDKPPSISHQRDYEYLPYLDEIRDKDRAQAIIDRVTLAAKSLKGAFAVNTEKKKIFAEFQEELRSPVEEVVRYNYKIDRCVRLVEEISQAYDSANSYLAMQEILKDPLIGSMVCDYYKKSFDTYSTAFDTRKEIMALLTGKSKYLEERQDQAMLEADCRAKQLLEQLIIRIKQIIEKKECEAENIGDEIKILMFEFSRCDSSTLEITRQKIINAFQKLKTKFEETGNMAGLMERLHKNRSMCDGYHCTYFDNVIGIWERTVKKYAKKINNIEEMLSQHIYEKHFIEEKSKILKDLKTDTDKEYYFKTRESENAVYDLNCMLADMRSQLKLERSSGDMREHEETSCASLSKMISQGRLFTHAAPNELMYEILEDGILRSHHEVKNKKGKAKRTHERGHTEWTETHDICFDTDRIYTSYRIPESIALIFSENTLVSEGRLFVEEDGIHLYDEHFLGEKDPDSPGLNIDLKTTPFMIMVNNREKEKLLKFLITKSAWRDELGKLDGQQLTEWIDNNIIFVDNFYRMIVPTHGTPYGITRLEEDKTHIFNEKKRPQLKTGHVEITEICGQMKDGKYSLLPLMRFIPRKGKKP